MNPAIGPDTPVSIQSSDAMNAGRRHGGGETASSTEDEDASHLVAAQGQLGSTTTSIEPNYGLFADPDDQDDSQQRSKDKVIHTIISNNDLVTEAAVGGGNAEMGHATNRDATNGDATGAVVQFDLKGIRYYFVCSFKDDQFSFICIYFKLPL